MNRRDRRKAAAQARHRKAQARHRKAQARHRKAPDPVVMTAGKSAIPPGGPKMPDQLQARARHELGPRKGPEAEA